MNQYNISETVNFFLLKGSTGCPPRLRLDGRVAYVTGGGQGIGRAFAHALGEAGAKVAVVDLVLAKAEGVKSPHTTEICITSTEQRWCCSKLTMQHLRLHYG
uniref:Uncharacterized protein n=1 Tax=Zosterops lateralis melanops TaxID=1220523 RepID=A0A8D2PKC9_ZOSLA